MSKNKNNVLFISCACSPVVASYIFKKITDKSGIAIQKFHRLLLDGFASNNTFVETLSTIPVSPSNHQKRIWKLKSDVENGVKYNYIPTINLPIVKNAIVFIYSFFRFLFWRFPKRKGKTLIICDVLSFSITSAAFLAFKIRRKKRIGIVTDIPGISVRNKKSIMYPIFNFFLRHYDGYVLLTQHMNCIVNPYRKPFMIMEGLVGLEMQDLDNNLKEKCKDRILMYAGGLYERYGIINLINAFMQLKIPNIKLFLFGEGELVPNMQKFMEMDSRIIYKGVLPNSQIVKEQLKATLLINPRPSFEEFSKYSFPSKNLEYMVSGTPLLTTMLPGLPKDHLKFVYIFDNETVKGMFLTLNNILTQPVEDLHKKGAEAKDFVLKFKNNQLQTKRILDFFW